MKELNKIKTRKEKRAQHEMVGFVLIVVIVVIVGMFFLMFYLRKPVETKSKNIEHFLESSILYTTDCSVRLPEYENIQGLIKNCRKNKKCSNDEMACDVLNETLVELIKENWQASSEKPINAYSFVIEYEEITREEIFRVQEWNNCTGSKTGAEHFFPESLGNIIITMEICYT